MLQKKGVCVVFCSQQPGVASAAWESSLTLTLKNLCVVIAEVLQELLPRNKRLQISMASPLQNVNLSLKDWIALMVESGKQKNRLSERSTTG